jgi:hypothetical protein
MPSKSGYSGKGNMIKASWPSILHIGFVLLFSMGCRESLESVRIKIYPDSVRSDVSHHPVGINMDYFTDDDHYLKPSRGTSDALKAMGVKYLRYPGGNKSDFYFFSVPPYEESIPTLARTGRGAVGSRHRMLKNYSEFAVDVLDFDEFMAICREIGAEPVITVAADEYLADYPEGCTWSSREELIQHAVEWVRYANVKKGHGIKYWMIGNESWHQSNPNSTAAIYARDVVDFSIAMKAVDPSIYIIPNGNSVEFCDTVLAMAGDHMDHLCISNYPIWQYREGYASYRDTLQDLLHPVNRAITALGKAVRRKDMKIIIAEYGPFDWAATVAGDHDHSKAWPMINDMGHALCNFEITGRQLLEPAVLFSQYWNTRWIYNDSIENSVYDALDRNGNFNAVGYALMIWGNFLGDSMVKTTSTVHLRTFASFQPEADKLFVYLMNMVREPQQVWLDIENHQAGKVLQAWELAGNGPADTEPVWRKKEPIGDLKSVKVSGTSITVLELQLNQR